MYLKKDNHTIDFDGLSEESQIKLLNLISDHLKCREDIQMEFTIALNHFSKLTRKEKISEVKSWINVFESIIAKNKQNKPNKGEKEKSWN